MRSGIEAACVPSECRPSSLTERLLEEKKRLINRLHEVEDTLDHLEQNPEVQTALDNRAKLGHLPY